jgi:hypothetical protein
MQAGNMIPSVVGGFQQWIKAGKVVKRGEHGMTIWFPIGRKNDDGNILEAEKFYTATVFDVSQVEEIGTPAQTPAPIESVKPVIIPQPAPEKEKILDPIMAGFKLV